MTTQSVNPPAYLADRKVGRNVAAFLAGSGRTQEQLAEALDVPASTLSRAINGKRRWQVDELERIADWFNVPVGWLFTGRDGLTPDMLRSLPTGRKSDFAADEQLTLDLAPLEHAA